jgi:hypothetical protein
VKNKLATANTCKIIFKLGNEAWAGEKDQSNYYISLSILIAHLPLPQRVGVEEPVRNLYPLLLTVTIA